jgi:3-oxoacyl-[acyl-carrier-protein] synthase-1
MRAGISVFEELDFVDHRGEPLYGSFVRAIASSLPWERSAALLDGALADIERWCPEPKALDHVPTILVTRGGRQPKTERALLEVLPSVPVEIVRGGPTAGLEALGRAATLLAEGRGTKVLICAVESTICGQQLHALRAAGRLRGPDNPHGVLPGEAAACLLVERARPGTGPASILVSLGVGVDAATFSNDIPIRAEGLTLAVRTALEIAGLDMFAVDWRLANHGDEGMFVKEQDLVLARLLETPKLAMPLWQPAEFIGELGVAAGLTQIIWALQAQARDYAPGPTALCICSDPAGRRAVVVIGAG